MPGEGGQERGYRPQGPPGSTALEAPPAGAQSESPEIPGGSLAGWRSGCDVECPASRLGKTIPRDLKAGPTEDREIEHFRAHNPGSRESMGMGADLRVLLGIRKRAA